MRLKTICNRIVNESLLLDWAVPEATLRGWFAEISPDGLLSEIRVRANSQFPFIYIDDNPDSKQRLYVGDKGWYHTSIVQRNEARDEQLRTVYSERPPEIPAAIGRVGIDMSPLLHMHKFVSESPQELMNMRLVAAYVTDAIDHDVLRNALTALVAEHLIRPERDYVSFNKDAMPVSEFIGGSGGTISDESKRLGELQIMLHLGADKTGKRLTPEERRWIEKELGIKREKIIKNPWQQEAENVGMVQPGQKWWAPTSESIE